MANVDAVDTVWQSFAGKPLVWITLINAGYVSFARNFVVSARLHFAALMPFLVLCLDQESLDAMRAMEVPALRFHMPDGGNTERDLQIWATQGYKRIVFAKLDAMRVALEQLRAVGVAAVGYIDTDQVLFGDPTGHALEQLAAHQKVPVFTQCDEARWYGSACSCTERCGNLCSGVVVFRTSEPALDAALTYTTEDVAKWTGDQECLSANLDRLGIARRTFDRAIMPNFPAALKADGGFCLPPSAILLHYNYAIGSQKIERMKRQRHWYI